MQEDKIEQSDQITKAISVPNPIPEKRTVSSLIRIPPKIEPIAIPHRTKSKQFTSLDFKNILFQGVEQGDKPQTPVARRRTMYRGGKKVAQKSPMMNKRKSITANKLSKLSLINLKDPSENDQCLTDEPSDILIGLDDLDDDVLERMDFQEAKLNSIEELCKAVQKKVNQTELGITRKMMSTLADVNTMKEEISQSIKTIKRDKHEIMKLGETIRDEISEVNSILNEFRQEFTTTRVKVEFIIKDIEMQVSLEMQDEVDKKSISLLGGFEEKLDPGKTIMNEPIKIDKNWISWSSNKSMIIKAFNRWESLAARIIYPHYS